MMTRLAAWLKSPVCSPAGFLVRAAGLTVLHALLTLCGLRSYMCVLSLTFPEGTLRSLSFFFCMIYLISYFAFILVVPVLVIAAAIFAAALRFVRSA